HGGYGAVGAAHHGFEAMVDFGFGPVEAGEVLDPLEIADRYAARIGQHVGNDQGTLGSEDVVRLGRGGAVGAFDHDFRADAVRVFLVDLAFQGRGNQEFGFKRPEFGGGKRLGARAARD